MYVSTRGRGGELTAAAAIKSGIAPDGGLFVPEVIPHFTMDEINALTLLDYRQRALIILERFLQDYSHDDLVACVEAAYNDKKFDAEAIAPVIQVEEGRSVLELWHGPTSAFKDMALQLLPQLLSKALKITGETKEIVILVATSGDTGKAALEGFRDVHQTRVIVFYPHEGVSEIQRLQMITQQGRNVAAVAVRGNFDDAQNGVKNIFNDRLFNDYLGRHGFQLSSANSINWGRLAPQIVYYFSAYAELIKKNSLRNGQQVNFAVPTGNFGNILAGYYAKLMGLPVGRLICASNSNNVLTDFLQTGIYDRRRTFYKTLSPSMDILISSNLERLLFHITNKNAQQVAEWMKELADNGVYNIGDDHLTAVKSLFWADWVDDRDTTRMIGEIYNKYGYLADPHTAVAWKVADEYRNQTLDDTPLVILSTASPFKFNECVLNAIADKKAAQKETEFEMLAEMSRLTGWHVPEGLALLQHLPIKHSDVCGKEDMADFVKRILL